MLVFGKGYIHVNASAEELAAASERLTENSN